MVNGARGFRVPFDSRISITDQDPFSSCSTTVNASSIFQISFEQVKGKVVFPAEKLPSIISDSNTTKITY